MLTALETKEWMSILMVSIVGAFLLVVCRNLKKLVKYIGSPAIRKPTTMEPTRCNNFLFSLSILKDLYKQSTYSSYASGSSIMYLIMEGLRGACCEMMLKERIFFLSLIQKPLIFFYKPETVQVVLSSTSMIEKAGHYDMIHSWLGTGLFTSPSEKWRNRRKLLTPTFHLSILEDFIPVFQEQSSILVSKLQSLTKELWVDIVPLATSCTLDIICQTSMGVKINAQKNGNKEYVNAVHELPKAILDRVVRPWLLLDSIFYMTSEGKKYKTNLQCVHRFTRNVIKDKKEELLQRNKLKSEAEGSESEVSVTKRKPFLEFLLEYHFKDPSFTEEDIREEVDTFMFGGHDTTGMGISWFLYCIGLYPDIQAKIVEELDEIFENDPEREVTRTDILKMKYLECCIKETFRLYPPAPFFLRECTETFEVLGHTIYEGSVSFIFPYALHRDRETFPDPEKFIPERFFPENSKGRHPYAYIPFSGGPRNCIGQKFAMLEMKSLAANVLRRLRVTSLDPRDKVQVVPNFTLQNAKPLRLRFETRRGL